MVPLDGTIEYGHSDDHLQDAIWDENRNGKRSESTWLWMVGRFQ
jgi:hypothetical protein